MASTPAFEHGLKEKKTPVEIRTGREEFFCA
jgi:hypothetical protein